MSEHLDKFIFTSDGVKVAKIKGSRQHITGLDFVDNEISSTQVLEALQDLCYEWKAQQDELAREYGQESESMRKVLSSCSDDLAKVLRSLSKTEEEETREMTA